LTPCSKLDAQKSLGGGASGWFQQTWMIQATTKGWEWANPQIAEMDNAEYHKEKDDFFRELS